MVFRTRFSKIDRVALACDPKGRRTKSEFKKDCDINLIMERYKRTGQLPQFRDAVARYGDFSQVPDYHTMYDRVLAAEAAFMALPADVRKEFGNDPGRFIEAAETKEGHDLLVKLGLASTSPQASPEGIQEPEGGRPSEKKPKASKGSKEPVPTEPVGE